MFLHQASLAAPRSCLWAVRILWGCPSGGIQDSLSREVGLHPVSNWAIGYPKKRMVHQCSSMFIVIFYPVFIIFIHLTLWLWGVNPLQIHHFHQFSDKRKYKTTTIQVNISPWSCIKRFDFLVVFPHVLPTGFLCRAPSQVVTRLLNFWVWHLSGVVSAVSSPGWKGPPKRCFFVFSQPFWSSFRESVPTTANNHVIMLGWWWWWWRWLWWRWW